MAAALCGWHVHHPSASRELKRRLGAGESLILAAPTLVEAYAVLSRLPPPHRLSPAEGWTLIRASFVDHASDIVSLESDAIRRLLDEMAARGVAGGGVYDAHVVACALLARVDAILTFNARQFRLVAPS
ncbi:MAG TPA: PIN domain-containing protein, partial [Chloroflexota bacterium]|nr:PIN domain-containing protein [Chloroflexota bacterium]